MNWSNGQLARHSRKRYNTDSTKQKQYFAEAKRRKVTEPRQSRYDAASFIPSYLQDAKDEIQSQSANIPRLKEPKRRLLTLNEPLQNTPAGTDYSNNNSDIIEPKRVYSTEAQSEISIDAKRRKLLQQSDWSGVELQKPVIIKYPETSRSATMARQRAAPRPAASYSLVATTSYSQIPRDAFIKIASQEYRYSPGNNSILTRHSRTQHATPTTPVVPQRSYNDTSSSASRSCSSFVPESPCARRALQAARGKEYREPQLQSIAYTSPSTFDELSIKAVTMTQVLHQPQPVRQVQPIVCLQLSDPLKDDHVALSIESENTDQLGRTIIGSVDVPGSRLGDSIVAETIMESGSHKISESPIHKQASNLPHRQSLFGPDNVLQPPRRESPRSTAATYSEESQIPICSIPSSITTPDIYKFANAKFPDNRPLAPPYIRPAPAPKLGDDDENNTWKRFLFGSANLLRVTKSAEHCNPEMPPHEETDSRPRPRLNDEISTPEQPPTRMLSAMENASPGPSTRRRRQSSTPAAATGRPTPPPLAFSAKGQEEEEAMTALFSTGEKAELRPFANVDGPHMTSKPESLFHLPSLFVGRLAANGGAGAVAVPSAASEMQQQQQQQHCAARIPSPTAIITAPQVPVVFKRKRRRRRDTGRPDIRALPNIRGDPIEFTP